MRFDSISRRFAAFLAPAFVLALGVVVTIDAFAQPGRRGRGGIAIRGATIHTMSGDVIEKGTILIAGGKIREIGADADISVPERGFEVIDATGKTIIPGLVDADSALMRAEEAGGNSLAYSRAIDALNPYDADAIREALANGVTTIFASPAGRGGIHGMGAVVKLDPNRPMADRVLDAEAALCGGIGVSPRMNPVIRAKEYGTIGKLFEQAKAYLDARDDYDEEFEEYKEEIEKRAKENEKKDGGDKDKKDEAGDDEKKDDKKDEGDTPKADEPKDDAPESPRRRGRGPRRPPQDGGAASTSFSLDHERLAAYPPELATWLGAQEEEQKKEGDDKKDEKDDLKRPDEPKRQAATEALVRALEGDVPLRMSAHRAEDILNAIAIAEEYGVRLVIDGATEGYKVAKDLAEHDVAVVVDAIARRGDLEDGIYRDSHPGNAAELEKAGVHVVLGSGAMPNRTRFLWLDAALAASHGLSAERALAAITIDAAKLLGVDDSIGSLEVGKDADLVVLSGSPFSGTTVVESVFVNGRNVTTNP